MAKLDTSTGTYLTNLYDPEVLADIIDEKFIDNIVFAPLCSINTTLQGRAGDTITLPYYGFIGTAEDVNEGEDIPIKQLTEQTKEVKTKKIGLGVAMTDEALISAYGDPASESVSQLRLALADKEDNDILKTLEDITGDMEYTMDAGFDPTKIPEALAKFGEEINMGAHILICSTEDYIKLLNTDAWIPASEIAANIIIRGTVGQIYGCQVVITDRLKGKNEAFIVRPGAIALYLKRNTMVEMQRNPRNQTNEIYISKIGVSYLQRENYVVKISLSGE